MLRCVKGLEVPRAQMEPVQPRSTAVLGEHWLLGSSFIKHIIMLRLGK